MSAFDDLIEQWMQHITAENLPPWRPTMRAFRSALMHRAIKIADGNMEEAARLLGIKRTTLLEAIKSEKVNNRWAP